mgnify:FL=1
MIPKLESSILIYAFRGELVPQNSTDRSAAKLLEGTESTAIAKRIRPIERRGTVSSTAKAKDETMANLIEILQSKGNWVSTGFAAKEFGIRSGSTSDEIETFYNELRVLVLNKKVEVERKGEEDWLRLVRNEVD